MEEDFRILHTLEKCDDGTESYSIAGAPKTSSTVAASLG
jgi:hypothetical protein